MYRDSIGLLVSTIVPWQEVIEIISPPYRLFKYGKYFITMQRQPSSIKVEFIGLSESAKARMENTVEELIIIPAVW